MSSRLDSSSIVERNSTGMLGTRCSELFEIFELERIFLPPSPLLESRAASWIAGECARDSLSFIEKD